MNAIPDGRKRHHFHGEKPLDAATLQAIRSLQATRNNWHSASKTLARLKTSGASDTRIAKARQELEISEVELEIARELLDDMLDEGE